MSTGNIKGLVFLLSDNKTSDKRPRVGNCVKVYQDILYVQQWRLEFSFSILFYLASFPCSVLPKDHRSMQRINYKSELYPLSLGQRKYVCVCECECDRDSDQTLESILTKLETTTKHIHAMNKCHEMLTLIGLFIIVNNSYRIRLAVR